MCIHLGRAREKFAEVFCANGNRQRQANGRPQAVATAHPIPKAEGSLNAEFIGGLHIGGERGEVAGSIRAALCGKPCFGRLRIGHRLNRGEGFGGDEEERALWLEGAQCGS